MAAVDRLRWVSWLPLSGFGAILTLLLAAAILMLPGITQLPVLDREESRFVQISRAHSGASDHSNWINGPDAFPAPLVHHIQASFVELTQLPDNILPYRLASALGAVVASLLIFGLGRRMFNGRVGWLAALATLAAPLVVWDAKQAKPDMWLMATTVAGASLAWRMWRAEGARPLPRRDVTPLGLVVAISVLINGMALPLMLGFAALSLVLFDRSFHRLGGMRPWTVLGVALAALLAGFMVVTPVQDWSSIVSSFEAAFHMPFADEAKAPARRPLLHLLMLPIFLWPLSLFFFDALRLCWVDRDRSRMFLLAWIVPCWVVLEILPGKQWHHVLPLYPLAALLLASAVAEWRPVEGSPRKLLVSLWGILGGLLPAGVWMVWGHAMLNEQLDPYASGSSLWFCVTLGVSFFMLGLAVHLVVLGRAAAAVCAASGTVAAASCAFCTQALPGHEGVWITNAIISALESSSGRSPASPDGPELGAVGYSEPSLIFATGNRLATGLKAPLVWIQERPDRWLLDDGSLGTLPENLVLERQIRGYCIPEGKPMDLRLIRPQ
jgi:4-amino-4-deoxy-L-arabinose transferase-like glycosyltransferase